MTGGWATGATGGGAEGRHAWIVDDDPSAFHLLLDLGERLFQFLHRRESRCGFGHCTNHHSIEENREFSALVLRLRGGMIGSKTCLVSVCAGRSPKMAQPRRQHLVHDAAGGAYWSTR